MKKTLLGLAALAVAATGAFAAPKALYVKQGDKFTRYNFGVAGDLNFSNGGHTLTITGYNDVIDLDNIDYITFNAPIGGTALTPAQQKEKLVAIGQEMNDMFRLADNSDLIKACYTLFNTTGVPGQPGVYRAPADFELDQAIIDAHDEFDSFKKALKAIQRVAGGDVLALRAAKANSTHIFKLTDYYGIYTANYEKRIWEKTSDADYFEMRYANPAGGTYSIKLTASEDYSTWNTEDFQSRLPKLMTVTVSDAGKTLATATVKAELVQDSSMDIEAEFSANGYVVKNVMNVVNNRITDTVAATINGKHLCKSESVIDGKNLVNYSSLKSDIKNMRHDHDQNGNCIGEDRPELLLSHFVRGNVTGDVLGKLQAYGKIINPTRIEEVLSEDSDAELVKDGYRFEGKKILRKIDGATPIYEVSYDNPEAMQRKADCLNSYSDAYFRYSDSNDLQGFMAWEPVSELDYEYAVTGQDLYSRSIIIDGYLIYVMPEIEYDNQTGKEIVKYWYYNKYKVNENDPDEWSEPERVVVDEKDLLGAHMVREMYQDCQPMLMFPDMTSFSFEDFFDETSFRSIIDDSESIVDTYDSIINPLLPDDYDE